MSTPIDLQDLLERVPEAAAALDRIPGVLRLHSLALGTPTLFWNPESREDSTSKLLIAALQLQIEAMQRQLREIEDKHRAVRAAERNWRVVLEARDHLVVTNDAGDVAGVPLGIAVLVAARRPIDAEVRAEGEEVVFERAGQAVARIPRTLFACFEKVVERHARDRSEAWAALSLSRESHVGHESLPPPAEEDSARG
ncbi:MAG: hypothetical protein KIT58_03530 [Planctomycetota bacterium]|nr:hypothetical protein [Planctomycetota bacterium]